MNTNASVDHECRLADGVHVAPGARIAGCVEIGRCAMVGIGAVILPRLRIGEGAIVGAGAVVTRDVPDRAVVYGNPARIVRQWRFEMNSDSAARMAADADLQKAANELFVRSCEYRYSYNFSWMGRPIIQYPQDMVAMQEIIWSVRPDLVIETGIAHGGSLVYYASLLELLGGDGFVVGIDIDIRPHNREAIESHPMARRIRMIEGSSIDAGTVAQVAELARHRKRVLVTLDSNHTHDHVLQELRLYARSSASAATSRCSIPSWRTCPRRCSRIGPGVRATIPRRRSGNSLATTDRFVVDKEIENKLLLTVAPDGYLRCVKS